MKEARIAIKEEEGVEVIEAPINVEITPKL